MKPNRTGYVYSFNQFAGEIQEYVTDKGYEYHFAYTPDYLRTGLPRIGYNLPLTTKPYVLTALPPFFANLMSEGWVKRHQEERARGDIEDDFGLLLANGRELIGAISIYPEFMGETRLGNAKPAPLPKQSLKGYRIDFPRSEFNEVALAALEGTSISGIQPKMFLTYADAPKTLTNAIGIGPYIVKPSPSRFPELAINEYIIMRLCKLVGFEVAEHHLVPFSCNELAYVTARFDIDRQTGLSPDFVEDMASVLNLVPGQKSSTSQSYERAIKTAHALSGGHASVLVKGYLQVLMAYIVGNNDLHLKNLSLRREVTKDVASGFTPLYDMVSVAPYRVYDASGELSLWLLESEVTDAFSTTSYAAYGYYTGHDFVTFGCAIGLPEKMAATLMNELTHKVLRMYTKVIKDSPGSEELKSIIGRRITDRIAALGRPRIT